MPKYRNFYPHKLRIDVIIDYARYDENEAVKDWLLLSRIWVIFWLTYSPNLNLIEDRSRCLKKRVISNTSDEAFSDFTGAILDNFVTDHQQNTKPCSGSRWERNYSS